MLPFYEDYDPYPGLRMLLGSPYQNITPEEIESIVEYIYGGRVTAEDIEAFPIIPIITGLISAAPAIIQGIQSLTSRPSPPPRPAPPPQTRPAPPPRPRPAPPVQPAAPPSTPAATSGGQPALQLLGALTAMLPQILQAVGSMTMREYGNESIYVGNRAIPVESVVHMIKVLSEQVIEDYRASHPATFETDYLLGQDGEYLADPANPDERAQALYGLMADAVLDAYESYYDEAINGYYRGY